MALAMFTSLSRKFRFASSQKIYSICRFYSDDSNNPDSSINPYVLFIKEKSQSGEKVEGGIKGYAKLWKGLPETIKQKYREKAVLMNQNLYDEPEKPKKIKRRKKKFGVDLDEEYSPETEDKFMNLPYEPIPKKDVLSKLEEREKKEKRLKNKLDRLMDDEKPLKKENPPKKLVPISPYYIFMTRVSPKLPDSPQKAGQLLAIWRKLTPEKKEEYNKIAAELTQERKEKYQGMVAEKEVPIKNKRDRKDAINEDKSFEHEDDEENNRKWLPSYESWQNRMDELLEAVKKGEKYKQEQIFSELSNEEVEIKKQLLSNYITVNKDNIGTEKGPLEDDKSAKKFKVKYISMKGEENENKNDNRSEAKIKKEKSTLNKASKSNRAKSTNKTSIKQSNKD